MSIIEKAIRKQSDSPGKQADTTLERAQQVTAPDIRQSQAPRE